MTITASRPASRRVRFCFAIAALALLPLTGSAAPEGDVRFYQIANSPFDQYLLSPTTAERNWMLEHYYRIQGWSPFFDSRLAWYPNGWVYKDAYAIKPGTWEYNNHPEWILRDAAGNKLYIPFACGGGTCPQYAGDFGNPAFRAHWISKAQALQATGYVGMWIDDVNMAWRVSNGSANHVTPVDPRTGNAMTLTNWRRYMAEFMEQARAALPGMELGHNIIWYAGPEDNSDPLIQRQIDAASFINLERGVTDAGLTGNDGRYGLTTFLEFVDYIHGRNRSVILMDEGGTNVQREYALAGWLLINNGTDMMSSEKLAWTAPDSWWHGYDTTLGEATSGRYFWNNLIRRDFDCGMVLLNRPDWPSISVSLGDTYTDIDGQTKTSVTLAGDQAIVLSRACANGTDTDGDGIKDTMDNCLLQANADQRDTDADGYGNVCDADFDANCVVAFADLSYLGNAFLSNDPHADLTGDGIVNFADLSMLSAAFLTEPGPAETGHCP